MPIRGDAHSRAVFWLKILLPLAALAILSTMFLVARNVVSDSTIPFSDVNVDDLARDQRLTLPEYSTVTEDGASLSVSAETARPAAADGVAHATVVHAVYARDTATIVTLDAPLAALDAAGRKLVLTGGVTLRTAADYILTADKIDAAMDRTDLLAQGPVDVKAPLGHIESGEARLTSAKGVANSEVLVFNKGVRLVYLPKP